MRTPLRQTVFYGSVVSPVDLHVYKALPRCLLFVGSDGNIKWLIEDVPAHDLQTTLASMACLNDHFIELKEGEFLLPGFVDTHTHAPQVPNIGSGQQYELLDWLENVTFPMEAQLDDVKLAKAAYTSAVKRIIDSGTTTCCYYATLHLDSTKVLADVVHHFGQRAFVGKCNMDRRSPPYYVEPSADASMEATNALIDYIRAMPSDSHVQPVLTPRFAISCTRELLTKLGNRAKHDPSLLIQTHISENVNEIRETLELFPECKTYAGVYDSFGLLGPRTVLGHAVHLTDDEIKLVARRGAGVAHCPTSNFNLRSGICNVGGLLDCDVNVGLGTDMSGGFSTTILTEVQHASFAAKVIAQQAGPQAHKEPGFKFKPLSIATCLHLATLGGARVCGIDKHVGALTVGRAFDALLVSVRSNAGNPRLWGVEADAALGLKCPSDGQGVDVAKLNSMLERFLFTGDDRNIRRVYVQGRWIGGAEHHR